MNILKIISIIKYKRMKMGISQKRLSELAGMQRYEVNRFEAGKMNIKYNRLITILDILGLELEIKEKQLFKYYTDKLEQIEKPWQNK